LHLVSTRVFDAPKDNVMFIMTAFAFVHVYKLSYSYAHCTCMELVQRKFV